MNKMSSALFGYVFLVIGTQLIEIKHVLSRPNYVPSAFLQTLILCMCGAVLFYYFGDSPSSTEKETKGEE